MQYLCICIDILNIVVVRCRPKVILGVTNPFFTKTLQHWPHIVRIGDASSGQASAAAAGKTFKKSSDGRTLDTKPGLYSQYKPFLAKDKALLKRILKVGDFSVLIWDFY